MDCKPIFDIFLSQLRNKLPDVDSNHVADTNFLNLKQELKC